MKANPKEIRLDIKVFFLFSIFWCWQTTLTWAPPFVDESVGDSLLWTVSNLCSLVASILVLISWRAVQNHLSDKRLLILSAALLEAGTLATIAVTSLVGSPHVLWQAGLYLASGFLSSLGILLYDIFLVRLLARCHGEQTRTMVTAGATVLKLLVYLLFANLFNVVIYAGLLLAPLLLCWLLLSKGAIEALACEKAVRASDAPPQSERKQRRMPSARFLAILVVLSFSINFMRRRVSTSGEESVLLDSSIVALMLVFISIGFAMEFLAQKRQTSAISIVVSLYFTSSLFLSQTRLFDSSKIEAALIFACFFLYITMLYRLATGYAERNPKRLVFFAAAAFVCNSLGRFSSEVAWLVQDAIPDSTSVLAYAVTIAAMFFFTLMQSSRSNALNARSFNPNPPASGTGSALTSALNENARLIAVQFRLTKSEHDVLLLTLRGKTYTSIAKQQGVSPNTVKSHLRAIYTKTDCHSAEELFSLVEEADAILEESPPNLPPTPKGAR